jgi:hypothetical protein
MSTDYDPVQAVEESIESLKLHDEEMKPQPDISVGVDIDIKHKSASVEVTDHLP